MKKRLLPLVILLTGCATSESVSMTNDQAETGNEEEVFTDSNVEQDYGIAFDNASEMQLFLYEDMSTVTFKGDGNEFASYSIKTTWLNDNYVRYKQDNGGVVLAKYYRVLNEGIFLIEQIADEAKPKTVSELEQLPVISTVLLTPIAVGTTFDGWTIEAVREHYTTPYETFDKVIVLTKKVDHIIEHQYFVAGIGAIAYEYEITEENGERSIISSKLASISY